MNKNIFFKLAVITIIAFLLRSWHLDKPEGLWNDEYVAWFISSQNSFADFSKEILNNCHMPIYYIVLKIWSFLFSDADLSLRFSSVLFSTLSVIVMFFAGKEYKDEKTGLVCAIFCALSSFLIYFAQEVRIYSLLFLFSSLSLFAWIKCAKDFSKKNYLILLFFNTLLFFTHTIGFVFIFFNIIFLFAFKIKEGKLEIKKSVKLFFPYFIILLLISPFIYKLGTSNILSQFWSNFNFSKVYFVLSDFFSPLQINIINTPQNMLAALFKAGRINVGFIILSLFPSLISLLLIIKAIKEEKSALYYFLSCVSFFSVLILAAMLGQIVFITKYSIEIYPFLILALSKGLLSVKKQLSVILLTFLISINILYLIFSNNSAPKLTRPEGNFVPVALIEQANLSNNDIIVLTYYDKHFFTKYFDPKNYNIIEITKYNYQYFLFSSNPSKENIIRDKELKYIDFFKTNDTKYFKEAFRNEIYSKLPKHSKIAFIFLDTVSFYPEEKIQSIEEKEYKNTPFIFLAFSYLKNNIIEEAKENNMKLILFLEAGVWNLVEFEKE